MLKRVNSAIRLAALGVGDQQKSIAAINRIDREVAEMGHAIVHPGPLLSSVLVPIRIAERRSVADAIDVLGAIDPPG